MKIQPVKVLIQIAKLSEEAWQSCARRHLLATVADVGADPCIAASDLLCPQVGLLKMGYTVVPAARSVSRTKDTADRLLSEV